MASSSARKRYNEPTARRRQLSSGPLGRRKASMHEKKHRVQQSQDAAADRRDKAIRSLSICFSRNEVMRVHHDVLVTEILSAGGIKAFDNPTKKARFITYISYWFAGLAAVIERYQELKTKGTIPISSKLEALLTPEFFNLVKPFRNAVVHCTEHDDKRVLELLSNPETIPDWAGRIAVAFREYFKQHGYGSSTDITNNTTAP
jgi:hypothetical protein